MNLEGKKGRISLYLFIHRRDLRTYDLPALELLRGKYRATGSGQPRGIHLLLLDPRLLTPARMAAHSGRNFLKHAARLAVAYAEQGKCLHLAYGNPAELVGELLERHPIAEVAYHRDYTPYARERDAELEAEAKAAGCHLLAVDDQPLAELDDFHRFAGRSTPYKVFTPFYNKWKAYLEQFYPPASGPVLEHLALVPAAGVPLTASGRLPHQVSAALLNASGEPAALANILHSQGHIAGDELPALIASANNTVPEPTYTDPLAALADFLSGNSGESRVEQYAEQRDSFALEEATSSLSQYFCCGALSVRSAYEQAYEAEGSAAWIRQLAWRDFYLYQSKINPDFFRYEHLFASSLLDGRHFEAWANGRTGIPIIDAAMRQLQQTGEMPNRLRMVTAMFLCKNLLCPFALGEAHFRLHLRDYDNVQNRGGWLWSASLGFDAAPYFRVMNPATQSQTYDPDGNYILRWLPELQGLSGRALHAPRPDAIVDLKASRAAAIETYAFILGPRPQLS